MEENFKDEKFLPWALSSNFRSGRIGGWKEEFDSSNIDKFKKQCGDALIKLGYERFKLVITPKRQYLRLFL